MTPPVQTPTPAEPKSPWRADAPPDRAIFTVLASAPSCEETPAVLHDFIGEAFEREVSETGRADMVAELAYGMAPGTYVWEGAVTYTHCGGYENADDFEMSLSGETRLATFAEARAVASDEYPWDRALWMTDEWLTEQRVLEERAWLIERTRGDLEDAAFVWIKHTARVPSSNVAAAVFMAAKKLFRAIEDPL